MQDWVHFGKYMFNVYTQKAIWTFVCNFLYFFFSQSTCSVVLWSVGELSSIYTQQCPDTSETRSAITISEQPGTYEIIYVIVILLFLVNVSYCKKCRAQHWKRVTPHTDLVGSIQIAGSPCCPITTLLQPPNVRVFDQSGGAARSQRGQRLQIKPLTCIHPLNPRRTVSDLLFDLNSHLGPHLPLDTRRRPSEGWFSWRLNLLLEGKRAAGKTTRHNSLKGIFYWD